MQDFQSSRDESRPEWSDDAEWKGRRSTDRTASGSNRLFFPKLILKEYHSLR